MRVTPAQQPFPLSSPAQQQHTKTLYTEQMWRGTAVLLLVASTLASPSPNGRTEKDVIQRDFPMALPNTGFVSAKSAADTVMLKLIRKVNSPGFCKTIEIINQPSPNSSPFVGSSEFTLVPDQLYHEHYAWTNGAETLSYVPVKGRDYGNWLIGNEPGVDNGYVYLGTSMPSLTPINLEGADSDHQWKWLIDMKWEDQPQMRAICKDTYKPGNVYYEIEYFDQITRQAVKSAFVPDLNPFILSLHRQLNPRFDQPEFQSKEANLLIPFPSYFEVSTRTWRLLDGITVVAEFGSPVMISRTKQQTGASESHIGVLVNEEHSGKFGWRLAFRNYAFSHLRGERNATARSKATQTLVLEPSITQIGYKPFKSTLAAAGVIPTSGAATQASLSPDAFVEYTEEEEQEYTVEIDNDGCLDDYRLEPLPSPVRRNFQRSMQHAWETIRPGDYVWLWHTRVHRGPGNFTSVGVSATGDVTTGRIPLSERSSYDNDWQTDEVSELLVRCKSRSNSTLIFQYFHTDRRDVMRQSFLDRDTDYFVVQLSPPGAAAQPLATFRGRAVQVKTTIVLGADIVNYVRRFLLMKEGKTHGLSSCYMYHAAVSMPQALIYGAEILCVLIGSKPVTMIQYTTSSDHQWKFPLVTELVRAIVAAKIQLGAVLDLDYEVFRYRNDETLIIYRSGKKYLAGHLLPHKQAQALHPVPYPDDSRLLKDEREQIYNSAWNGFVLGYPGFFVESYCESFHNSLSLEEKRRQLTLAEHHFQQAMLKGKHPTPVIKLGSSEPIAPAQYELIRSIL